ncbi:sulfotransferase family protein [Streptomyces sp. WMMC500]|uniref:sulfotransferase family protein n=1 Tax=Streptomyces sp. WMMC500 TaxID=3015154 RepID=UPI00248BAD1A|nr:sulfotransferase family protein [Streptomyces sp. WMMC500]WBB62301.1 sulfotransferase family protein [Streptomyces sp. WMMC500]
MLDVLGTGAGRTGTKSLKLALEKLGFGPCHHMLAMLDKPDEIPLWEEAAEGRVKDWSLIYSGYRSSVDWPGARYWREIAAAFPQTKVIHTVRDPEGWYESVNSSIYAAAMQPSPPDAAPVYEQLRQMSLRTVWDGVFDGRFADKEHALKVFTEHNDAVVRGIDDDRLLVFEVSQGWAPLCAFLDVPVPEEPFPHSNDRAQFASLVKEHTERTAHDPS